jgi:lipoprotein-anchoring transpeptidase ErfK/SrfK
MKSIAATIDKAGRKAALVAIAMMIAVEVAESQQTAQPAVSNQPEATRDVVILVSIPDRKLAVIEDGKLTHTFPVAVGKESSPSPSGDFTIVSRVVDPTYYHPGVVIPAGPQSPLGTRWIGLSKKGFGIHGTNEPRSIGKAASHGCIRMRRTDVEQLFTLVRGGDVVTIRSERDEQVAALFGGAVVATADVAAAPAISTPTGN